MGRKVNKTIMRIQIHPICYSLMNMKLMVVHLFEHSIKMMEICLMIKFLENWVNSEPNKHRDPNSPNMAVFIEYDISGCTFLLLPQEYGPKHIIGPTFLPLPQEYDHKFWVHIVTMID